MITTLLGALTVVSIKGLGVGVSFIEEFPRFLLKIIIFQVILLILTIGQMIARSLPSAFPLAPAAYAAPQLTPYW